jgi:hypothetical protein
MGRIVLLVAIIVSGGCAGITAKKVPLDLRLCRQDYKQEGFRYYLSRPHVVVSRKTVVLQATEIGALAQWNDHLAMEVSDEEKPNWSGYPYAVQLVGDRGEWRYLDLAGRPLSRQKADFHLVLSAAAMSGAVAHEFLGAPGADSAKDTSTPEVVDTFQIVHLPDFEEQMAVKHHNFLASGKFELKFLDGWQLKSAGGSFDSTEVPVEILKSLQNAITAAADIEEKRIQLRMKGSSADFSSRVPSKAQQRAHRILVTRTYYIDAGMYRWTKESERHGCEGDMGWGILADMGIPVLEDVKVQLLAEKAPAGTAKNGTQELPAEPPPPPEETTPASHNNPAPGTRLRLLPAGDLP